MNHIARPELIAQLIAKQETDALDDGFPYERIGVDIDLDRGTTGWVTPTPFMIVAMKEILDRLVSVFGWNGHWLLREIGRDNLRDPQFVSGLGLAMFLRLYDTAIAALPAEQQEAFR